MSSRVANCENRGFILFRKISLPQKPKAFCDWCKSNIKTNKTVMGIGRNNYLLVNYLLKRKENIYD